MSDRMSFHKLVEQIEDQAQLSFAVNGVELDVLSEAEQVARVAWRAAPVIALLAPFVEDDEISIERLRAELQKYEIATEAIRHAMSQYEHRNVTRGAF